MKYMVLGAGMQGRACAYDMLRSTGTESITLADADERVLGATREYLGRHFDIGRVLAVRVDAADAEAVGELARGHDAFVSAVPYFLNLALAKAAVRVGVHYVDLGGNTDIVRAELALHEQAKAAGVCVLPDNGLGPGMITTLAVHAMNMLDTIDEVLIRDGGLPQRPVPPMNYLLTFSEHGLINEYIADATALRDGQVVKVAGLSEVEVIDLPAPLGRCEAAHAAGGLSTLAETYAGRVRFMDNKLIRYPGHCAVINAMTAMGFFSDEPIDVGDGVQVAPRAVAAKLFRKHFERPGDQDLVVIHNTVRGTKDGRKVEIVHHLLDTGDPATQMTAMMRTTGFPASIVAQMAARGVIKPGAYPVELGVPPEPFIAELRARGFELSWEQHLLD